jgi:hypothetical protein
LGSVGTHDPVVAPELVAPEVDVAPLAIEVPEVEVALPDAVAPEAPLTACAVPLAAPAPPLPGLPEPPGSPFSAPFDEQANNATRAHTPMRFGIRTSELA